MICSKCGNEIQAGNKFCGNCGAQAVGDSSTMVQLDEMAARVRTGVRNLRENMPSDLEELSGRAAVLRQQLSHSGEMLNRPIVYLGIALMQMLTVFLWFADCVRVTVFNQSQTASMHELFGGVEFLSYITVACLVASAVNMLLPVIRYSARKHRNLVIPKAASIWTLCMYIIGRIASTQAEKEYSDYNASVGLTVGGCILGFLCVASVILIFLLAKKRKSARRTPKFLNENCEKEN